jgi:hypothetical protein
VVREIWRTCRLPSPFAAFLSEARNRKKQACGFLFFFRRASQTAGKKFAKSKPKSGHFSSENRPFRPKSSHHNFTYPTLNYATRKAAVAHFALPLILTGKANVSQQVLRQLGCEKMSVSSDVRHRKAPRKFYVLTDCRARRNKWLSELSPEKISATILRELIGRG